MKDNKSPSAEVALTKCYFCLKDDKIIMNTTLTKTWADRVSAAHGTVIDAEPCGDCAEMMKKGVIIIVIDPEKSEPNWNVPGSEKNWLANPYRSGGWYVMSDEGIRAIMKGSPSLEQVLKHRFTFLSKDAEEALGLQEHLKKNTET
jgi:hypothetical protein